MKSIILILSVGIHTALFLIAGNKEAAEDTTHVDSLIEILGHSDFASRESASLELWAMGDQVVSSLEEAVNSGNPEVSSRALKLIRYIAIGVSPDTPKDIALLIQNYSTGNLNSKKRAMQSLARKKAYRQMLHLLAIERNKEHQLTIWEDHKNIGLHLARQSILLEKFEDALEILKLCPPTEDTLKARSFLLYRLGLIDEELASLPKNKNLSETEKANLIEFLVKLGKKLSDVETHVLKSGDLGGLASVRMLKGDPLPALEFLETKDDKLFDQAGLKNLQAYVSGKTPTMIRKSNPNLRNKIANLKKSNDHEMLMRSLFISGLQTEGEIVMQLMDEYMAFSYFDSLEKTDEVLKIIGFDLKKDIEESLDIWRKEIYKKALDDDLDDNEKFESQLIRAASFFHHRGESHLCNRLLDSYFNQLEKKGMDRWSKAIIEIVQYRMNNKAFELCVKRGNDNNEYSQLVGYISGSQQVDKIWKKLQQGKKTTAENFLDLTALIGFRSTEIQEIKRLHKKLFLLSTPENVQERVDLLDSLAVVALRRNDLGSAFEIYEQLAKSNQETLKKSWSRNYRNLSFDLMEWEDVIKAHNLDKSKSEYSSLDLAKLGIAYRKIGRLKKGDKIINLAITHSLFVPSDFNEIARTLYISNYEEEAVKLWRQSILVHDPGEWQFHYALQHLSSISNYYISNKNWKMASSLSTIEAGLNLARSVREANPIQLLHKHFEMLFTQGMNDLSLNRREIGLAKLKHAHQILKTDGFLADAFFPILNEAGLRKQCLQWANESINALDNTIHKYPKSHNTLNTSAWILSRSLVNLEKAHVYSKRALEIQPNQGAYLDTLAEVHFAMKDRNRAIKWSKKAIQSIVEGGLGYNRTYSNTIYNYWDLHSQLNRFSTEKFPKLGGN